MTNRVDIEVVADTGNAEAGLERVGSSASTMGDRMSSAGRSMSLGVTLPLVAAGTAAFSMASDLGEATSQAEQVFGDSAAGIIDSAGNLNDSFSEADFLGSASRIGNIAQGMGFAQDASDDLAASILSLGQDQASFNNMPTEQAVDAITSALTGEREALKGLGVVITQEEVNNRALADSGKDAAAELTQQEKATATLALITEKSSNVIGDFERTSDGAANSTRILSANFKDTAATLGENLLPIGMQLLGWANSIATAFGNLSPTMQKVAVTVAAVAAAIGPMLILGAKLIKVFQALKIAMLFLAANPYVVIIAATVALVVVIVKNWDEIMAALGAAWDWIKDTAAATWNFIKDLIGGVASFLTDLFLNWTLAGRIIKHWDDIKAAATATKDFITGAFDGIISFFVTFPSRVGVAFQTLAGAIRSPFESAFNAIRSIWNSTAGGFGFTIPSWVPGLGGNGFHIPEMHQGGVFRSRGGEGLALLQDGETVLPRGVQLRRNDPMPRFVTVPVQVVMPNGQVLAEVVAQANLESGGQLI